MSTLLHSLVKRYRAEEGDLEKAKNLCQQTSTPGEPNRTRSGLETDVLTGGFATLLLSLWLERDVLHGPGLAQVHRLSSLHATSSAAPWSPSCHATSSAAPRTTCFAGIRGAVAP